MGISFLVYAHFVKIITRTYNYGLMYRVLVFTAFVLVQSVSQMPEQMLGMRFLLQNKEESVCKQTVFKVQPNNKLALRM